MITKITANKLFFAQLNIYSFSKLTQIGKSIVA